MATPRSSRLGFTLPSISPVIGLYGNISVMRAAAPSAMRIPTAILRTERFDSMLSCRTSPIESEMMGAINGASNMAPITTAALSW